MFAVIHLTFVVGYRQKFKSLQDAARNNSLEPDCCKKRQKIVPDQLLV